MAMGRRGYNQAGQGIMVSDFITEYDGYLALDDDEYRPAIELNPAIFKAARVHDVQVEGY